MDFTKIHGLGNDYVYVNCFAEQIDSPAELAVAVSDRHRGIGADGLILIGPSETADVRMRMFNADGSEAQMCGNGIRCVAKYVFDRQLVIGSGEFSVPGEPDFEHSLTVETGNGILILGIRTDGSGKAEQVCVNMGQPIVGPAKTIPVNLSTHYAIDVPIEVAGEQLVMTCVSMGNPHAVFFCDDTEAIDLERIGPAVENHELFPERVNAHFVKIDSPTEFTMRTWERGSGITQACGTGACACAVAAALAGRCERIITAHLPGGDLRLNWVSQDNCIYMTGPAVEVFTGTWPD